MQRISRDQNPELPRSVQINISGDQLGVLNVGGEIDSIEHKKIVKRIGFRRRVADCATPVCDKPTLLIMFLMKGIHGDKKYSDNTGRQIH